MLASLPAVQPRFPIYIVSKGRADSRLTVKSLNEMRVDFRIVVEHQEREAYAAVIDPRRILVLDPAYQRDYDTCDSLGDSKTKGSGPARNFVWDHAESEGHEFHWIADDNIRDFYRLTRNLKIRCGDGTPFRVMEDFVQRYTNIGMAGPNYDKFVPQIYKQRPITVNTRIYSCNLIRTGLPFRWRGRYNEDTDLSLRLLKASWCTVLFNAFLQGKVTTLRMKGGNTSQLYAGGTLEKSKMIVRLHPDVAKLVYRFNRPHHHVDYRGFQNFGLVRREDIAIKSGVDNYGLELRTL
jgi:hypothetical protein